MGAAHSTMAIAASGPTHNADGRHLVRGSACAEPRPSLRRRRTGACGICIPRPVGLLRRIAYVVSSAFFCCGAEVVPGLSGHVFSSSLAPVRSMLAAFQRDPGTGEEFPGVVSHSGSVSAIFYARGGNQLKLQLP
jgi:hypothetical protein